MLELEDVLEAALGPYMQRQQRETQEESRHQRKRSLREERKTEKVLWPSGPCAWDPYDTPPFSFLEN